VHSLLARLPGIALLAVSIGCSSGGSTGSEDAASASASSSASGTGGAGGAGSSSVASASATSTASASSSATGAGGGAPLGFAKGATWQWQLSDLPVDTSFDVEIYDIDLFDNDAGTIADLHALGRRVVCYFSAGSFEDWRPDAGDFPESAKGDPLDGWPGERWLDVRAPLVRDIMKARLDLAAQKGCDGVEPDNVDGYANDSGLPLTGDDQLDYNRFLAAEAHARGLSIGLKNDLDQLDALVDDFDWALNEECFAYDECDAYAGSFLAQGKAVLHAEYVDASELDAVCAVTKPLGLSTILKNIDLDAPRVACP
jgi:hypothetical protein